MTTFINTYNVRGLSDNNKRQHIFRYISENQNTISLLQETHSTPNTAKKWELEWEGQSYFSGQQSNKEGVAILIHKSFNGTVSNFTEIIPGRMISLNIAINNWEFTILNIYGPNTDNGEYFKTLVKQLSKDEVNNYIIGGDFNTVIDIHYDKKNGRIDTHKKCREILKSMMTSFDLIDIWRLVNPNSTQYTWHSNTKPIIFSRLDYFLISDSLTNIVKNCKIKPGYKSDHSSVHLSISFLNENRGPGYFKLNNSLLIENDYQEIIKKGIADIADTNKDANPNTLWEIIKGEIRNLTIKYASYKKRNENKKEIDLSLEIHKIKQELASFNSNSTNKNDEDLLKKELIEKQEELESIIDIKLNGIMLRAKAQDVEGNEKNGKYFASLEKHRAEKKTIYKLRVNEKEITNQKDILKEEVTFYTKLYTKQNKTNDHSRSNLFIENHKSLNDEESSICEGLLNEYECLQALNGMENQKSPGSDGLTAEFYKTFWTILKKYLIDSLNYSYQTGKLTQLQKQAIITLLPKTNKDTTLLANWRPISLLNIDYKIATKSLANRLKKVIGEIIENTQTGFIKG